MELDHHLDQNQQIKPTRNQNQDHRKPLLQINYQDDENQTPTQYQKRKRKTYRLKIKNIQINPNLITQQQQQQLHQSDHPIHSLDNSNIQPAKSILLSQLADDQHSIQLGSQICQYTRNSTLNMQQLLERKSLIIQIYNAINQSNSRNSKRLSSSPYTIQIYGSACFGLDSPQSDLDLTIIDPDRPKGVYQADQNNNHRNKPKVFSISKLANVLTSAKFTNVKPILKARIPLIKFQSEDGKIFVDLTYNNLFACRNSSLIKAYYNLSPHIFRPLALTIKCWAKARGFCDPAGQNGPITASSYTLVLLLIGYLQVIHHLPNLQDLAYLDPMPPGERFENVIFVEKKSASPNQPGDGHHRRSGARIEGIDTSFVSRPPKSADWKQTYSLDSMPSNDKFFQTISQILLGFFDFYARFEFHNYLISIRDGRPLKRQPPLNQLGPRRTRAGYSDLKPLTVQDKQAQDPMMDAHNNPAYPYRVIKFIPAGSDGQANRGKGSNKDNLLTSSPPPRLQQKSSSHRHEDEIPRGFSPEKEPFNSTDPEGDALGLLAERLRLEDLESECVVPPYSDIRESKDNGLKYRDPTVVDWAHPLVVVDPFLFDRNTAGNIRAETLKAFRAEFLRARMVLQRGGSLADLCSAL